MELLDLKNDKSIILKYVITGIVGISFGVLILILIYILSEFFFGSIRYFLFESYSIYSITIMTALSAAFFGITSKDFKKTIHFGLAGAAVGILIGLLLQYGQFIYGLNYFSLPLITMTFWGFAIGLPKIKNAIHSALAGMTGGVVLALIAYIPFYMSLQLDLLIPSYVLFFFLSIGAMMGLITYAADRGKGIKPSFNTSVLAMGSIFVNGLLVLTVISTVILAFLIATSNPPEYNTNYDLNIRSSSQDQYSIYFPFLVKNNDYKELLKEATLNGNGSYSVVNSERGEALLIYGRGNIVFKVNQKSGIPGTFSGSNEVYFQGINTSVNISMKGSSRYDRENTDFELPETTLVEGWQKINVDSYSVVSTVGLE